MRISIVLRYGITWTVALMRNKRLKGMTLRITGKSTGNLRKEKATGSGINSPYEHKQIIHFLKSLVMKRVEALNDLIRINNDRVDGYTKAALQTADEDLRSLFTSLATQSSQFATELKKYVREEGEDPAEGTTVSGKIYRTWMDVKATFGGDDRKGLLSSCEFGEDAAQKAYKMALEDDDVPADVRTVITDQKAVLKEAHDRIRDMRDATQPV